MLLLVINHVFFYFYAEADDDPMMDTSSELMSHSSSSSRVSTGLPADSESHDPDLEYLPHHQPSSTLADVSLWNAL